MAIRVRNKISLGLVINAGLLLASSRRLNFSMHVIALGLRHAYNFTYINNADLGKFTSFHEITTISQPN